MRAEVPMLHDRLFKYERKLTDGIGLPASTLIAGTLIAGPIMAAIALPGGTDGIAESSR